MHSALQKNCVSKTERRTLAHGLALMASGTTYVRAYRRPHSGTACVLPFATGIIITEVRTHRSLTPAKTCSEVHTHRTLSHAQGPHTCSEGRYTTAEHARTRTSKLHPDKLAEAVA